MIITLCGSSKFKDEYLDVEKKLVEEGHAVLMPNLFHHADNIDLTVEQRIQLDNIHKQKINLSDAIFVINKDKYIGESTYSEIDWAQRMKKEIYFLEDPNPEQAENSTPIEAETTEVTE